MKLFDYKDLSSGGEKAYVLNNLEIATQIIIKTYKEMNAKANESSTAAVSEASVAEECKHD